MVRDANDAGARRSPSPCHRAVIPPGPHPERVPGVVALCRGTTDGDHSACENSYTQPVFGVASGDTCSTDTRYVSPVIGSVSVSPATVSGPS